MARRRDALPVAIVTKEPDPRWFPWDARIPNNDPGRDDQSRRLKALGDAVLPIVGWAAGRTAARVLEGWWPSGGVPLRGSRLPMNGAQQNGQIVAFAESPFEVYPLTPSRGIFVTVDEEFMGSATNRTTAPMVGRILPHSFVPDLDPEDNVDIELPGGWTQPFPYGWTKPLWPTLTSNDGRNKGSRGQWRRRTKALNVLAQSNQCPRDEWAVVEVIVNMFAGQGVGPRFGEWVMGFPPGWTDLMGQDRHSSESLEPIKYMELR